MPTLLYAKINEKQENTTVNNTKDVNLIGDG